MENFSSKVTTHGHAQFFSVLINRHGISLVWKRNNGRKERERTR